MNRRTFLTLAPAALATLAIAPSPARALATPVAAPAVPTDYADVAAQYEGSRQRALTEGRRIASQVFGGDIAAVYARASEQLQAAIDLPTIEAGLATLTSNRVSFAAPDLSFFFDGQLAADTISGFLSSSGTYGFVLERAHPADGTPLPSSTQLDGSWTGHIDLGAGTTIPMAITFDGTTGTITLPEFGIDAMPLSGISFDTERPVGTRLADQGAPLSREQVAYWARYAWGDRTLSLIVAMHDSGTLDMVQIAPEPQLPPDPMAGYRSPVTYQLPFDGLWWVFWGGDRPLENYHSIDRRQRHAVDLVVWNDGATYRTDGVDNADYWIWGQPLYAPASGTVVATLDGVAENIPGISPPAGHPGGNHVIIQTAPAEFLMLAHLQPGSLAVATGDTVVAGQRIGRVGNSGNSTEPHLHIHLQNEADFFSPTASGLPLVFSEVMLDGTAAPRASLTQGTFVSRG